MAVNSDKERDIAFLIKKNKELATKEIYSVYAGYVVGICSRYLSSDDDIKDVAQDSFVKIFISVGSFRYSGAGSLTSWIGRVTVNCALNYLRDNNRLRFTSTQFEIPDLEEEPPDTECLSSDELAALIRALPDGYRTVFNLYAIEGKKHKEIAKILGIKENSSASQYLRAKAILAMKIKEYINNK
ncbi:MAG: sigma-70 family RNA polymerase sigma factor [Muribaculaceae bacterium]|nr:sigma-70 family RNA polymerase sigma factor [Muribaculaceae bacterium]MDE6696474.1 sigma-70 family RNA polymerase sigma factor [Muribaculaceae bacterium]